jgi:hypothetical protein
VLDPLEGEGQRHHLIVEVHQAEKMGGHPSDGGTLVFERVQQRGGRRLSAQDKDSERRQRDLMLALAHCGEHTQASRMAAEMERTTRPDNELLIHRARTFAQCVAAAETDAEVRSRYTVGALLALRAAITGGYRDEVYLKTEADLDPLRQTDGFSALLKEIKAEQSDLRRGGNKLRPQAHQEEPRILHRLAQSLGVQPNATSVEDVRICAPKARSVACFGLTDRRAQANRRKLLRSDTPKHRALRARAKIKSSTWCFHAHVTFVCLENARRSCH